MEYKPSIESNLTDQKFYLQQSQAGARSKKMFQFDFGKFQQVNASAGWWQETDRLNFGLVGGYSRSDGQFQNSQFSNGKISGQVGGQISPDLTIKAKGNYRIFDYGLFGAEINDLKRKNQGSSINISGQWNGEKNQSAKVEVFRNNKNFNDKDSTSTATEFSDSEFGLNANYKTKIKTTNVSISGYYYHNNFDNNLLKTSEIQNYFLLKPEVTYAIKQQFIFRAGLVFQDLEIGDLISETLFSPEVEIIFTPSQKVGFNVKASRGFTPMNYYSWWQKNPFITNQFSPLVMKKNSEVQFGVEYSPSTSVTFKTNLNRQVWGNYAYWSRNSIGLFQLNRLDNVSLYNWNLLTEYNITSNLKLEAGLRMIFDSIEDDTLSVSGGGLPYQEKLYCPINLNYQINQSFSAAILFSWIGPRKISFLSDDEFAGFGLLSVELQKELFDHFSIHLAGKNLLNQKYFLWQNYQEMGIYFEVGFKGNW